jgi:hypothetical protein
MDGTRLDDSIRVKDTPEEQCFTWGNPEGYCRTAGRKATDAFDDPVGTIFLS